MPHAGQRVPAAPIAHTATRDLLEEVFAGGMARLRTEDGATLRVERVATYRDLVVVHAPRLALETGLMVTGTCETPHPWAVTFLVRDVTPHSASAETASLEAVRTSLYPERRHHPRVEVGGAATVTVHHGVEMVEKECVAAVLVDASRGGIAFASSATIAVGTQVTVEARLLLGHLCVQVLVRWRGSSRVPEMHHYGCEVLEPNSGSATILSRLVAAAPGVVLAESDGAIAELRRSVAARPGRRRFMRRRAHPPG